MTELRATRDNLTMEYPADFLAIWDGCADKDCLPQCTIGLEGGFCERLMRAFSEYQASREAT